jgi:hypothetical protein
LSYSFQQLKWTDFREGGHADDPTAFAEGDHVLLDVVTVEMLAPVTVDVAAKEVGG